MNSQWEEREGPKEKRGNNFNIEEDKLLMSEARRMFHEIQGQPFRYDHCWVLLRNEQKWIDRENKSVVKRKSPIPFSNGMTDVQDLREDNRNERPISRKAAKERKKLSLGFSTAFSTLKDEKKKSHEEKMLKCNSTAEQRAELLAIQKAQLFETKEANRIKHEKLKLQREKEDMNIMFKDTTGMTPKQLDFLEICPTKILQRRRTTHV